MVVTLERERVPKREAFFEFLGTFLFGEWQAQSDEEAGAKIGDLVRRRRFAIELFDLVSDDGAEIVVRDTEGNFRFFRAISGGPVYLELAFVAGLEEPTRISFFLRYFPLRIAQA